MQIKLTEKEAHLSFFVPTMWGEGTHWMLDLILVYYIHTLQKSKFM